MNGAQEYGGLASHGHSGFILPAREVARMRTDVTRMYLLGFYRQSGPPAAIAAQIRDVQSGDIVFDARWQAASATSRTQSVGVTRALVPGRNYRLWVAFNKPMRVRDATGAVVAYRGQSAGASVGTVSLQIPSLANQSMALSDNAAWLNAPGGAPSGYLRYADDAFAVEFTLPATLAPTASTGAALALTIRDLADMSLDSNPATVVDWSDGHWVGYENGANAESDSGGADCGFKPFIALQPDAAPPAAQVGCVTAILTPSPAPAARSSGGGGSMDVLVAVLLLVLASANAIWSGQLRRTHEYADRLSRQDAKLAKRSFLIFLSVILAFALVASLREIQLEDVTFEVE
jgi:hypothetical protein